MNKYSVNRPGKYRLFIFLTVFALIFMLGAMNLKVLDGANGQNVPSAFAAMLNSPNRHHTATPAPTNPPRPTNTARPVHTPEPTNTTGPTDTPRPTRPPAATHTPRT